MAGFGFHFPVWPGLDHSAELEELRRESERRARERRAELIRMLNEERESEGDTWTSVRRRYGDTNGIR